MPNAQFFSMLDVWEHMRIAMRKSNLKDEMCAHDKTKNLRNTPVITIELVCTTRVIEIG